MYTKLKENILCAWDMFPYLNLAFVNKVLEFKAGNVWFDQRNVNNVIILDVRHYPYIYTEDIRINVIVMSSKPSLTLYFNLFVSGLYTFMLQGHFISSS